MSDTNLIYISIALIFAGLILYSLYAIGTVEIDNEKNKLKTKSIEKEKKKLIDQLIKLIYSESKGANFNKIEYYSTPYSFEKTISFENNDSIFLFKITRTGQEGYFEMIKNSTSIVKMSLSTKEDFILLLKSTQNLNKKIIKFLKWSLLENSETLKLTKILEPYKPIKNLKPKESIHTIYMAEVLDLFMNNLGKFDFTISINNLSKIGCIEIIINHDGSFWKIDENNKKYYAKETKIIAFLNNYQFKLAFILYPSDKHKIEKKLEEWNNHQEQTVTIDEFFNILDDKII